MVMYMDKLINNLKSKKLISKEDIMTLRKYIDSKYIGISRGEKAMILAKSIHTILNLNLKQFSPETQDIIKNEVIKSTLIQNRNDIYIQDIFKTFIYIEDKEENLSNNFSKWLKDNIGEELSLNDKELKNYLLILRKDYSKNNTPNTSIEERKDISADAQNDEMQAGKNIDIELDDNQIFDSKPDPIIIKSNNIAIDSVNKQNTIFHITIDKIVEFIKVFSQAIKIDNRIEAHWSQSSINMLIAIFISSILISQPLSNIIIDKINQEKEVLSTNINQLTDENLNSEENDTDYSHLDFKHIPMSLRFKQINEEKLQSYLMKKDSLLVQEPYFSTIITSAKRFNLNPFVLFAIAGHEQAFVPSDHEFAQEIGNNPFNVFHSWQKYNTDIQDSSTIAARTVFNLLKERPTKENPFKWINRKYAQDKNWYKGVEVIYNTLEDVENED